MAPNRHAVLSASSSHRWLHCNPSARLEQEFEDWETEAAAEGTAAHALAEHKLRKTLKMRSRKPVSKYGSDEMDAYTDGYVEFVLEALEEARQLCSDPKVLIEQRLDFSCYVPDGFGTGDCLIVADKLLHIIDLKYGQGVLVDATENPQMMLYALGALRIFDCLYDIESVSMTIYQPRRENVSTWVNSHIPVQPRALRVCAYARVSSGKDVMLHSLSAQVSYYSNLIQNHSGWLYCGVYSDEAMTGTKSQRDDFQRMIEDCRKGKIDLIITKNISRFARNTVTLLQIVRELKSIGIDVYFEEQHIHTISADGELMMTILASYAQEESLSASENQKCRVRKAFENGELINLRFLFGYSITADGVQINEKEAAVVREIFSRFNGGESMSSISRDLNARGYRGALGGKWFAERMRNTLSNEKYLGNALLQKRYRNNHIEKKLVANKGELPMYYAEGTHEPIIDSATFEQAQERLRKIAQQTANRKKPSRSAFSGLIRCGICGNTYKRVTYRGRHFWNCTTFQTKGKSECTAKKIPEDKLVALALEVLGIDRLSTKVVKSKITEIRAEKSNVVVFCMEDGSEIVKRWKDRSRAESWTPEMKE